MPGLRVQIDDVRHIGDTGAANTSSGRSDGHALLLTPADQFGHAEHETVHLKLLENPHLLRDRTAEGGLLLRRDYPGAEFFLELSLHRLHKLLAVRFPGAVQNRILDRGIQLQLLGQVVQQIRVFDCGHIVLFRQGSLCPEQVHQLIVGFIAEVEGILVPVGLVLGHEKCRTALRFVWRGAVGIRPGNEWLAVALCKLRKPLIVRNLIRMVMGLNLQKVVFPNQFRISWMILRQAVQGRCETGACGEDIFGDSQELVKAETVVVVKVLLVTGTADQLVQFPDSVHVPRQQNRVVIVPYLFFQRLRQVDFHGVYVPDSRLLAGGPLFRPVQRLSVFGDGQGFLPVCHGQVHVVLRLGAAVQQAVFGMAVVHDVSSYKASPPCNFEAVQIGVQIGRGAVACR